MQRVPISVWAKRSANSSRPIASRRIAARVPIPPTARPKKPVKLDPDLLQKAILNRNSTR